MTMPHILLIDDDPDFLDAVSAHLQRAGYRVTSATGCDDGLAVVSATPETFDAIVVDIFMPEIDGLETIGALRKAGVTAPVVAISSGGQSKFDAALGWATALGADASLAKPFDAARLAEVLEDIEGARGGGRTSAAAR